jgi:hypothetical protein
LVGCGAFACDSWRIFCRDALRGRSDRRWILQPVNSEGKELADVGANGASRENGNTGRHTFYPMDPLDIEEEWKRVLPKDKELRPFIGWMWLKEGWIWDPETGYKERAATDLTQRAENKSIDWMEELKLWKEDLARRGVNLGESERPTEGKIEGPRKSYIDFLSSSGSSDELSDVPSSLEDM